MANFDILDCIDTISDNMMNILNIPLEVTPLLLWLTFFYLITSAISIFDVRITQAQKNGEMGPEESTPQWVGAIHILDWIIFIVLLIVNWKYALIVKFIIFVFKVLPILEIIGNFLLFPFKKK